MLFPSGASAQCPTAGFWQSACIPSLAITTSAQSFYASNCSAVVTFVTKDAAGTQTNVGSNLTVSLTATRLVTFYSDNTCTASITSVVVASGRSTGSFYFISISNGSPVLTAAATSYTSAIQTETIATNPDVWTGRGGNATGRPLRIGPVVRMLTHAIAGTVTVNEALNFNMSTNHDGLLVGTLDAKGNVSVTVGANASSTATLRLSGTGVQTFTGTFSGTFQFQSDFTYTAGTLSAGTSTVQFKTKVTITLTGPSAFNDVSFAESVSQTQTFIGTMNVCGNLTLTNTG